MSIATRLIGFSACKSYVEFEGIADGLFFQVIEKTIRSELNTILGTVNFDVG